jgi:hypothetical protein
MHTVVHSGNMKFDAFVIELNGLTDQFRSRAAASMS